MADLKASGKYRLLYFSPEPETGERVCVGILVEARGESTVLTDPHFRKLHCVAPRFDLDLVGHYLSDLTSRVLCAEGNETDILRLYLPQLQCSEVRQLFGPITERVKQRLIDRFLSPEFAGVSAFAQAAATIVREDKVTENLENYLRTFNVSPRFDVIRRATPKQLFGIKSAIKPVALAIAAPDELLLIDGVDLKLLTPSQAVAKVNRVVHSFWQYGRIRQQFTVKNFLRIGIVLNGIVQPNRAVSEAHDYAVDQFSKESEVAVDEGTGAGRQQLMEVITNR